MPKCDYINVTIGNSQLDIGSAEDISIGITYKLEDIFDFQNKKSSELFGLTVPATLANDKIANTFRNPGIEDMSVDKQYTNFRSCSIEADGALIFSGQAKLKKAKEGSLPVSYSFDLYGNNGDWIIPLKESTLFDFVKGINFLFTKQQIIDSWQFDGRDENLPYVFAPTRFAQSMEDGDNGVKDYNMGVDYMKPSISIYWIIYWAFKSVGYRIQSEFFETDYFRRQVMPWTWGNFLYVDDNLIQNLDFLAKSSQQFSLYYEDYNDYIDLKVDNETFNGAFDNNGVYSYNAANKEMQWTYLPQFNYDTINATFHISFFTRVFCTSNSEVNIYLRWFKNGVQVIEDQFVHVQAPGITVGGQPQVNDVIDRYETFEVDPGDVISAKVFLHEKDSTFGLAQVDINVDTFELEYFRIPQDGTIDFNVYGSFKKYKFLDLLAGILDCYNISPQTDPVNKVVLLEPMHDYSLTDNLGQKSAGFFNGRINDWNEKLDVSADSDIILFDDSDRELLFSFKDDSSDGLLKKLKDRYSADIGSGKYLLPDRFKEGKGNMENRFFSPTVHCELKQWQGLGTDPDSSPQLVCLVPENISNTSKDEAQNTFNPKICYYKGIVDNVGWVFDGQVQNSFPYMFAVNYQEGGQNDPVLSYSDEKIGEGATAVVAAGLLRRFFLQRMATMRNGQYYQPYFRLNNKDVDNWYHREFIIANGQKWELLEINDFKITSDESTKCTLRKVQEITLTDSNNVFPSRQKILNDVSPNEQAELVYNPLKALSSDLK